MVIPAFELAAATDGPRPEVLDASTTQVFRLAYYNVGMVDAQLRGGRREQHIEALVDDVERAFSYYELHVLLLCELGEHEVGLTNQAALLQDVVDRFNRRLTAGGCALEPTVRVTLTSAQHPTYAVIARALSPLLQINAVDFVTRLDEHPLPGHTGSHRTPAHCALVRPAHHDHQRALSVLQ